MVQHTTASPMAYLCSGLNPSHFSQIKEKYYSMTSLPSGEQNMLGVKNRSEILTTGRLQVLSYIVKQVKGSAFAWSFTAFNRNSVLFAT